MDDNKNLKWDKGLMWGGIIRENFMEKHTLNTAKMVIGWWYRKSGSRAPGYRMLDHTTQSTDPIQNCSESYDIKSVLVGFMPD